jgi:hypothetical protein
MLLCFHNWITGFWYIRNEGLHSSASSGTFLVDEGPYYFCVLEILLGRLSKSLYNQVSLYNLKILDIDNFF